MELFVNLSVPCVNAAITDHFVILFRDMADQAFDEFHNRKCFFHIFVIFMPVVVESDKVAIIFINPGRGDYGSPEIAPDIFYHGVGIAVVWLSVDIEAFLVFPVTACFHLFKRASKLAFHFIQKGGAERITEESIVKVIDITPETVVTVAAFRNQAVDMRIPFQIPAKGMKNHDKTGSEIHGHINFKKHSRNNAVYGMKEAVKEGTILQKEIPELAVNGENTVSVDAVDEFKGHRSSALHGVQIPAGRAEAAVAAEGNEF